MQQSKIFLWLSISRFKIEIVLAVLIAIAAWLNYSKIAGGQEMLMILMSTLAGFYFLSAYIVTEAKSSFALIGSKVFSIASSVSVIGLLYSILHLVGASQMLLIGSTAMGASGLIILFQGLGTGTNGFIPPLVRIAVLGTLSVSTLIALSKQAAI